MQSIRRRLRRSFNPRARVGRDLVRLRCMIIMTSFNPRARVGRDSIYLIGQCFSDSFQSTRPRGARRGKSDFILADFLFQSTRPRGARPGATVANAKKVLRFNPRARVGRDLPKCDSVRIIDVSIHAPAWGATSSADSLINEATGFNPRARVGRDTTCSIIWDTYMVFQSTRPRGARQMKRPSLQK